MIVRDLDRTREQLARLLDESHTDEAGNLSEVAAQILKQRADLLAAAARHRPHRDLLIEIGRVAH